MSTTTVFLIGATGHVGKALMGELAPDHAAGRLSVKVAARSDASRELVAAVGLTPANFDLDAFETFDADAITEPDQRAAHVTHEELDDHGTPCQSKAHRLKLNGETR